MDDNLLFENDELMEEQNDLNFEVGEEFVSIVKMEDAFNEEEDEAPNTDPLEISVETKIKKK